MLWDIRSGIDRENPKDHPPKAIVNGTHCVGERTDGLLVQKDKLLPISFSRAISLSCLLLGSNAKFPLSPQVWRFLKEAKRMRERAVKDLEPLE